MPRWPVSSTRSPGSANGKSSKPPIRSFERMDGNEPRFGPSGGGFMKQARVAFVASGDSTFVQRDRSILLDAFRLRNVEWNGKRSIPHLAWAVLRSDVTFAWFALDHAYGACRLAEVFGRRSIVVVGGVDVARGPELGDGDPLDPRIGSRSRYALAHSDRTWGGNGLRMRPRRTPRRRNPRPNRRHGCLRAATRSGRNRRRDSRSVRVGPRGRRPTSHRGTVLARASKTSAYRHRPRARESECGQGLNPSPCPPEAIDQIDHRSPRTCLPNPPDVQDACWLVASQRGCTFRLDRPSDDRGHGVDELADRRTPSRRDIEDFVIRGREDCNGGRGRVVHVEEILHGVPVSEERRPIASA